MTTSPTRPAPRPQERGAALLMMLLISALILAAGGALILSTGGTGIITNESTASRQAYYAAEAGLQTALNALRGNMTPDGNVAAGTRMNLRTAVTPDLSNGAGRSGGVNTPCDAPDSPCRLAGWLPYVNKADANSLVLSGNNVLVDAAGRQLDGAPGYRLSVYDPDASQRVSYSTSGQFVGLNGVPGSILNATTVQIGVAPDTITITYVPQTTTTINNSYPAANINLGSIQVTKATAAAALPLSLLSFLQLRVTVNQTLPYAGTATFKMTLSTPGALSCPSEFFRLSIATPALKVQGSSYALLSNQISISCPGVGVPAFKSVQGTVVPPEPHHIVVRATGFGPNFAQKRMEVSVSRGDLDFEAPATLTLRGADDCSAMHFDAGSSNTKNYRGADQCVAAGTCTGAEPPRPAFAVRGCDYDDVVNGTSKPGTVSGSSQVGIMGGGSASGSMSSEAVDTPSFLETADAARAYLNTLQLTAMSAGRYFKPPVGTAYSSNSGTATNPTITFVDGDCNLSGGAGLLVVTGNLNMSGNPSFDGVILVLGEGSVNRDGGGNGTINGAIVVAKFARTWPAADNALPHPFLAPTFNTNGSGNSDVQYNSVAVSRALNTLGTRTLGVREF